MVDGSAAAGAGTVGTFGGRNSAGLGDLRGEMKGGDGPVLGAVFGENVGLVVTALPDAVSGQLPMPCWAVDAGIKASMTTSSTSVPKSSNTSNSKRVSLVRTTCREHLSNARWRCDVKKGGKLVG